jgi:hypothetical protein
MTGTPARSEQRVRRLAESFGLRLERRDRRPGHWVLVTEDGEQVSPDPELDGRSDAPLASLEGVLRRLDRTRRWAESHGGTGRLERVALRDLQWQEEPR